jgi:hypothetical protein
VTIIPTDESADHGNEKATADPIVEEPSTSHANAVTEGREDWEDLVAQSVIDVATTKYPG